MANDGILLESGTNEVEILEFMLCGQSFGLNVAKTQAIEQFDPARLTAIPMTPPGILGMLLFRNRTLPLMDLADVLGMDQPKVEDRNWEMDEETTAKQDRQIVLVMEFNNTTSAVLVDAVNRIHRISWDQIAPLSAALAHDSTTFTGSVHIEKREILILDMEKIMSEVMPEACIRSLGYDQLYHVREADRADVKIVLAEDSNAIRSMIEHVLQQGNYQQIRSFDNGQSAKDYIWEIVERAREKGGSISDELTMLISDIEMPRMDGLTLCRQIKESPELKQIPVVLFSSLINEQMAAKCRSVGADGYISKPQIGELIQLIDQFCLGEKPATV